MRQAECLLDPRRFPPAIFSMKNDLATFIELAARMS